MSSSIVHVYRGPHKLEWRREGQPKPGPYSPIIFSFDGSRLDQVNGIEAVDRIRAEYGSEMDFETAMAEAVRIQDEVERAQSLGGDTWGYYPEQLASSL